MSVQHPPSSLLKLARAGQKPSCLIKMFAALSATNEAILRINSREKLFQQVCEAAMQSGSFLAAVILTPERLSALFEAPVTLDRVDGYYYARA